MYSPAKDVESLLAKMVVGNAVLFAVCANSDAGQRGIIHNPMQIHLLPHRIILPRCNMVHPIFVNAIAHPTLQRESACVPVIIQFQGAVFC